MNTLNIETDKKIKLTANTAKVWKRICQYKQIYFMLLPAIVFYLVFAYWPMYGITIAFKEFYGTRGIMGSPWVGFENFKYIFALDKFWIVFRNSIAINFLKLAFSFPAPIIFALLINELSGEKLKRVLQTIIYLPHFISWVTISGIIFSLLSNEGVVNSLIANLGGEKVNFLASESLFRPLLILSGIWKEAGWGTIIYLAALSGISVEQYEAAIIDGANRWQRLLAITLPSLMPTVTILLILTTGNMMTGNFDQVFNLYNPTVYSVGDIIETYIYRIGLVEGKFSVGTAVGLFLNVINFMLLLVTNKISKKVNNQSIF